MKYQKSNPVLEDGSICRNCTRCIESCPAEIPIADMLQIYQQYCVNGADALTVLDTDSFPAYPIDCIECGACSAVCPRKFDPAGIVRALAMASCSVF